MSIIYYPNRTYKGKVPAIDREMAKRNPKITQGSQDLSSASLDVTISSEVDWQINSIGWSFSDTTNRDFSASVKQGRKVVENLNDSLWFHTPTTMPQNIHMDGGFYTGTELAAELQSKMDATPAYIADGVTFTVSYDSATGLFTVTPSKGTIKYLNVNTQQRFFTRDSIAGHLFGFNVDGSFDTSAISDTEVYGLDSEVYFVNQTSAGSLSYSHNEVHTLDIDQAIHLEASSGAVIVDYVVNYEDIV